MVTIVEGNIFDSKANFIVHPTNCQGAMSSGIATQIVKRYAHVEKEYMKYIRYCKKNNIELLGTAQYVPNEVWALIMVDTMKNNNVIDFDTSYQYIVNLFCQSVFREGFHTDLRALKKALIDIREKAERIGATVAIPYKISGCGDGVNHDDVHTIIKKIFDKSSVNVEIWRYNSR